MGTYEKLCSILNGTRGGAKLWAEVAGEVSWKRSSGLADAGWRLAAGLVSSGSEALALSVPSQDCLLSNLAPAFKLRVPVLLFKPFSDFLHLSLPHNLSCNMAYISSVPPAWPDGTPASFSVRHYPTAAKWRVPGFLTPLIGIPNFLIEYFYSCQLIV